MPGSFILKKSVLISGLISLSFSSGGTFERFDSNFSNAERPLPASVRLARAFECFSPVDETASYSVSICADIPNDKDPDRIYYKKQPGHVFLILQKTDSLAAIKSVSQVFGFYPRRPVTSIMFKTVRCDILDNSRRSYNAGLTRYVTATEFRIVLQKATELAKKKYNLNRYNCYDYAVEVFNALPGQPKLPLSHVKFPFIFGKGGSPCALYRDLEKLKANDSMLASLIQFGDLRAPASYRN